MSKNNEILIKITKDGFDILFNDSCIKRVARLIQKVTNFCTYRGDYSNGQYKFVLSSENYPDICSDFNIGDFLKSEKLNYNFTKLGHIHVY